MRRLLRLPAARGGLLVLCVLVQSSAAAGPEAVPAAQRTSPTDILDQMWSIIGEAVQTATQATVTELGRRLGGTETRLSARVGDVSSQLSNVSGESAAQNSQLSARVAGLSTRLDEVWSELSAQLANQSGVLAGLARADRPPRDCSDLPAGSGSGVYLIRPGLGRPVPVLCDMDTAGGGWTVIQRRADIQPRQDFFRGWQEYKWGLGRLDGEFWWGLEHLWRTTHLLDRQYELRVDMEDFENATRHALYQGFRISPEEDGYRLTAVNYTGDAGNSLYEHSGMRFSTKDRDQDRNSGGSCAESYKGGWWYNHCHSANLNGLYLAGKHASFADGVDWQHWKGYHYSLKTVTMKIRPTNSVLIEKKK